MTTGDVSEVNTGTDGERWPVWLCETVEAVHVTLDRADTAAELGATLPDELHDRPGIVFAWIGQEHDTDIRVRSFPPTAAFPPTLVTENGEQTLTGAIESTGNVQTGSVADFPDVNLAVEHAEERRDQIASCVGIPLHHDEGSEGVLHLSLTEPNPGDESVLASLGQTVGQRLKQFADSEQLTRERERLETVRSLLSHDLGNPLNIASGRVELARMDEDVSHLENVDGALERAEELIECGVTLVEVGQQPEEEDSISLATLAEDCWSDVGKERGELIVEDTRFVGERERVRMLLNEVIRNAFVHSDGAVTVEIGPLTNRDGFFVADDGPGIPADERAFVLDTGYTTVPGRDGLGLSIVTEIAGAHGWDVTLDTSEAGGVRIELLTSRW